MPTNRQFKQAEILLVEDNPADVLITQEALSEAKLINHLSVVEDGVQALKFLRQQGRFKAAPRPDIILLDLNLPRKNGMEVLAEVKNDPDLRSIPVVVLTTSQAEEDILKSYNLHANAYIVKPVELANFIGAIQSINHFWLSIVTLPPEVPHGSA